MGLGSRRCAKPTLEEVPWPIWSFGTRSPTTRSGIFDAHGTARRAAGSQGGRLFRNLDDPNALVILFEWESADKARQFAPSADLRQTMKRAGVADQPDLSFLEEVDRPAV